MRSWARFCLGGLLAGWAAAGALSAQTPPQASAAQQPRQGAAPGQLPGAQTGPLGQLKPEQREQYDGGGRLFAAGKFAESLIIFRPLLKGLPQGSPAQAVVAEFASEAAINTGDFDFAVRTLTPIEAANANDWQAAGLLARAYAQSGQTRKRDAELARLKDLHTRAVTPQIAKLQQVLLERIAEKNGSIRVWYSLEPWGPYKTYISRGCMTMPAGRCCGLRLRAATSTSRCFKRSTRTWPRAWSGGSRWTATERARSCRPGR